MKRVTVDVEVAEPLAMRIVLDRGCGDPDDWAPVYTVGDHLVALVSDAVKVALASDPVAVKYGARLVDICQTDVGEDRLTLLRGAPR